MFTFYAGHMSWAALLAQKPWEIAPRLLGAHVRSIVDGHEVQIRLTEVEAYGGVGIDPGSHSFRGMTARTAVMFGAPGHAYIYFTYGMHWCLNIVAAKEGTSGGLLLRAGEVIVGADVAQQRAGKIMRAHDLAKGPARLARALGITSANAKTVNASSLLADGDLQLLGKPPTRAARHMVGPRTGVGGAGALTPWRFWLPDEPTVSPYKAAQVRTEHLRP